MDAGVSAETAVAFTICWFAGHGLALVTVVPTAAKWRDQRVLVALLSALGVTAIIIPPAAAFVWPSIVGQTLVPVAFAAGFAAAGRHVLTPIVTGLAAPERRGPVSGTFVGGWTFSLTALGLLEPIITLSHGAAVWRALAVGQAALGLVCVAATFVLIPAGARMQARENPLRVWAGMWHSVREPVARMGAIIMYSAGASLGAFYATYLVVLELAGQSRYAWVPPLAALAAAVASHFWGELTERHPRAALVGGAFITFGAFALTPLEFLDPQWLWLVITGQSLLVEVGTSTMTVGVVALLLSDDGAEGANALQQLLKTVGNFAGADAAGWLLGSGRFPLGSGPGLVGALGAVLAVVGVIASWIAPIGPRPDGSGGPDPEPAPL
jgi:predicted MFS family arabinose efflux permease